jgi:hypothetical protein
VPRLLRSLKLFDAEGLFVGDASYVFVPDNEHYEHSAKLLFDEHNHPVDPNKVDPRDRRYQWRRCYKLVSLIHVNRSLNFFLAVGARLAPGHQHECPLLYALVEEFLRAVGRGVMRVLIVDRGLLDGARMGPLKQDYQIDTVVLLKKNMDAYQDVVGLTRGKHFRWEVLVEPEAAVQRPARPLDPVLAQRERKRQATRAARQPAPASSPRTLLGLARGVSSWSECPVPLTAVIHREIDAQGQVEDWILVTTSASMSAAEVHATYQLRTAIEERHRRYKCFWDLAKMSACRFSLVLSQVLFLLLAYTLLEAHLVRRRRQAGRQVDGAGVLLDRLIIPLAHLLQNVAHLVHPATLVQHVRVDHLDGRSQTGTAIGHNERQVLALQTPPVQILQQAFPRHLAFSRTASEGQQLPASVLAHPVGHQHLHPLASRRAPHAQTHSIQEQVSPFVLPRRLVKLLHRRVQVPGQLRHRLRAHRLAGEGGHQPPHLARGHTPQERLPDQQGHVLSPTLKLLQSGGEEVLASPPYELSVAAAGSRAAACLEAAACQ